MGGLPAAARRRDRIVAARMPGVAAREAPRGEPRPAQRAEAPKRGDRVARAGGTESAVRPDQRADPEAVDPDEGDQCGPHSLAGPVECFRQCLRSEARRLEPGSRSAGAWATTTRSRPASRCWCSRKLSRTNRLRRLRRFARRTRFFATASPRRAAPALRGRAKTEKYRSDERAGSSNTRRKSLPERSRRSRPNERSSSSVRNSRRQSRAALGPPRLDDPPTRSRAHPGAKPAAALGAADARLKRSLHSRRTIEKDGEAYRWPAGSVNTDGAPRHVRCWVFAGRASRENALGNGASFRRGRLARIDRRRPHRPHLRAGRPRSQDAPFPRKWPHGVKSVQNAPRTDPEPWNNAVPVG